MVLERRRPAARDDRAVIHGSVTREVAIRVRVPTGWLPITLKQGFFLHALARADRPTSFELTETSGRKTLIPIS